MSRDSRKRNGSIGIIHDGDYSEELTAEKNSARHNANGVIYSLRAHCTVTTDERGHSLTKHAAAPNPSPQLLPRD